MLIIRHSEVHEILAKHENDVLSGVRSAYLLHHEKQTVLPYSTFLRMPAGSPTDTSGANRIIGLPAYLGGESGAAGMKWIASFPANLDRGLERASAVIVLNSLETGRPEAVIEASLISAARTAASAALAADALVPAGTNVRGLVLFGCGVINLNVLRYVLAIRPTLREVVLYDRDPDRMAAFAERCSELAPGLSVHMVGDPTAALHALPLVSLATTASTPHLDVDLAPDSTILHVSLRDLSTRMIRANHNVVDDVDHVLRERTSVHLAEQESGGRQFIDGTIAEVLRHGSQFARQPGKAVIFSPFGLGVLDIAVAKLVLAEATRLELGVRVDSFLPN
jgi:N-[(2S)-2-amino-2-carboxyethyl]-L-glutamate dehydrogenase